MEEHRGLRSFVRCRCLRQRLEDISETYWYQSRTKFKNYSRPLLLATIRSS